MLKFQRNYYAEFKITEKNTNQEVINEEIVTISYPITLNFQIEMGGLNSNNNGTFQFYNLPSQVQAKIWLDLFNRSSKDIKMSFYAGYGNNMPLVFQGTVTSCTSQKPSGAVDWITDVQVIAGEEVFQKCYINATFSNGTTLADVINFMLENAPDIKVGCVTPDIPPLPRNKTFIGQTLDLLGREYGGYDIIIDRGKLHILGDNDVIKGDLLVISDETGLLGSPRRANAFVEVDTLFEPQLKIGQAVSLLSNSLAKINKNLNQAYKVVQLRHYGIISAVICGSLKTTATLSCMEAPPRTIEEIKPTTYKSKNVSTTWAWPAASKTITSNFGSRTSPTKGASTYHKGIDIGAGANTPVYAAANGKVSFSGAEGGYGQSIHIDNGTINGKLVSSVYGHLGLRSVKQGQNVYKGDVIGYVGSGIVGISTGPHLHFEVRENGSPVNPLKYVGNM